ncbi:MAG: EAL domain-containing protein [Caulobacteraceae bacterium]|nr:EAL domain-containing protein [Caulobacteraceae bacterium]
MSIRQRLLGFAFASADLLIELSPDGRVMMALGMGPVAGMGPEIFQGRPFADRLAPGGGKILGRAMEALKPGARTSAVPLLLACGDGKVRRATFRAFMLPDLAPNISCSINYEGPVFSSVPDEVPPVLDSAGFLDSARGLLSDPDGGPFSVSFIDIGGLAALGPDALRATARVEATLQSASLDGASAARLTPERYALLRERDDKRDLVGEVREAVRSEGLELTVSGSTSNMPPCPPVNALRALRFTVEGCLAEGGLDNPDTAFNSAMARTMQEAESFRALVKARAFHLHYQPIVDLKTGAVHHFEALSRFNADASPVNTIRMAEELGLIEGFDLAVAEKALQRLRKPGSGLLKIAINVSGASLANDAYVDALLKMTAAAPDERRRLIVEITETAAMADLAAANRRLGALREAGIKLCIDDFGAGAASFEYIHGLAVDTVKIDGKFIQALDQDPKARTVVSHLVELCGSLNLTTIAEFVETESTAEILRGLGVDYAQGWLYGKAEAEPRTILQTTSAPVRRKGTVASWG